MQDTWDSICGGVPLDGTHARVQREWSRKERLKRQRTGFPEDTLRRLLDLVPRIREGEPNALFRAIDALGGPRSGYRLGDGFWDTLDAQPAELAEAVLSGLDRIVTQPRLPSPAKWVGKSSLPGEVGVPLCVTFWGIEAAMRSGDPVKDWPATRWQSLLAAAFRDGNRLPGWFGRVATHHPGTAHEVVRSVLRASLRNDKEGCRPAELLARQCPLEGFGQLALGELQRGPKLEPGAMKDLIRLVLASRVKGIEALVQERLDPAAWAAGGKERRGQALLLAAWWWLDTVPAFSWLEERLLTDEAHRAASILTFHEAATDLVGRRPGDERLIEHMSSAMISDVLPHIFEAFAPETDPKDEGGYGVTPEHEIRDFRDLCLGALAERADDEATETMERLRADPRMVPWRDIVEYWTGRLEERWLERAWKPPSIDKVRMLTELTPRTVSPEGGGSSSQPGNEELFADAEPEPYVLAITHEHEGVKGLSRQWYDKLRAKVMDGCLEGYWVLVDSRNEKIQVFRKAGSCRPIGHPKEGMRLSDIQLHMLCEYALDRGTWIAPEHTEIAKQYSLGHEAAYKHFQRLRHAVEVHRDGERAFHTRRVHGLRPSEYRFSPYEGLSYWFLFPTDFL